MKNLKSKTHYNEAVKQAYYKTLERAKAMLSTIEQEEIRYTLIRQDKLATSAYILHEFLNPLLYLRLECSSDNTLFIHFGVEQVQGKNRLNEITSKFIRLLYHYTSKAVTGVEVEDAVRTDWLLNSCSDAYEYVEERNNHHTFKQLPYKVTANKRKQLLSVA
ncbi:hypothetical protein INP83_03100 [Mucilaginibacter sp. 21P]|uniref:hypothetical protein n=1 Tax=Mucilaginibacter sp. 21P TaxID=2778902 RepID=UPI001C566514|nr:hypothetical protein [Mucilaginibacter sp. 21P]QXV66097.1 hypothetical protein INP83_03100 [Mucilaginibacter sp. 21P]